MAKTVQRTISREDYYKLHGLLALAKQHNEALKVINRAAAEITGEPDDGYEYFGATSDEINSDAPSANGLLRALEIEVEDAD